MTPDPPPWRPSLGAWPGVGGVQFRVWAPTATEVVVIREGDAPAFPLMKAEDGTFRGLSNAMGVGDRYLYLIDGKGPFPDPASRFQPEGVHGPSEVIDPAAYAWNDAGWRGVPPEDLVLYELHLGTFTPEGTYAAATARLGELADLGITAIELMPVADFPGHRGWGYDGVDLFAPARCYGRPDDLRHFVDEAHRLGMAVLLDVVYNHLGPVGNYLAQFSPFYFTDARRSPWGPAVNVDGEQSSMVREFFVENALHWVHEYHMDGLRLDATHHLIDEGPRHVLAELSARVRESAPGRRIHLIAEDPRNLASLLRGESEGGWGLDGVWSDDFHHQLRRYLVGDDEGVFRDFRGDLADLVATINGGWFFRGEYSIHRQYHRGTDPTGLAPRQFVFNIQNHDRIGNRALGERLNHQIDLATYRAAVALLLTTPATPLLFMGQEWAASTPFLFFTDHDEELGAKIREGRRHEFRQYASFSDDAQHALIPDIQAESTFLACKLDWSERDREPHASTLRLHEALLHLRRSEPAFRVNRPGSFDAVALGEDALLLRREADEGPSVAIVVRLRGSGDIDLGGRLDLVASSWDVILTTEDPPFASDPARPELSPAGTPSMIRFQRPSAIVLRASP